MAQRASKQLASFLPVRFTKAMSVDNRSPLFVRLPEPLKRRFQRVAARHGRSATKEVEKLLEMHVEKYDSIAREAEFVGQSR